MQNFIKIEEHKMKMLTHGQIRSGFTVFTLLAAALKRSNKVIKHAHEDDLQPFKAVMEDFFEKGM